MQSPPGAAILQVRSQATAEGTSAVGAWLSQTGEALPQAPSPPQLEGMAADREWSDVSRLQRPLRGSRALRGSGSMQGHAPAQSDDGLAEGSEERTVQDRAAVSEAVFEGSLPRGSQARKDNGSRKWRPGRRTARRIQPDEGAHTDGSRGSARPGKTMAGGRPWRGWAVILCYLALLGLLGALGWCVLLPDGHGMSFKEWISKPAAGWTLALLVYLAAAVGGLVPMCHAAACLKGSHSYLAAAPMHDSISASAEGLTRGCNRRILQAFHAGGTPAALGDSAAVDAADAVERFSHLHAAHCMAEWERVNAGLRSKMSPFVRSRPTPPRPAPSIHPSDPPALTGRSSALPSPMPVMLVFFPQHRHRPLTCCSCVACLQVPYLNHLATYVGIVQVVTNLGIPLMALLLRCAVWVVGLLLTVMAGHALVAVLLRAFVLRPLQAKHLAFRRLATTWRRMAEAPWTLVDAKPIDGFHLDLLTREFSAFHDFLSADLAALCAGTPAPELLAPMLAVAKATGAAERNSRPWDALAPMRNWEAQSRFAADRYSVDSAYHAVAMRSAGGLAWHVEAGAQPGEDDDSGPAPAVHPLPTFWQSISVGPKGKGSVLKLAVNQSCGGLIEQSRRAAAAWPRYEVAVALAYLLFLTGTAVAGWKLLLEDRSASSPDIWWGVATFLYVAAAVGGFLPAVVAVLKPADYSKFTQGAAAFDADRRFILSACASVLGLPASDSPTGGGSAGSPAIQRAIGDSRVYADKCVAFRVSLEGNLVAWDKKVSPAHSA